MVEGAPYKANWLRIEFIGTQYAFGCDFDEVLEKSKFECKYQSKVLQICWFECEYACVDCKSIIHLNLCVVLEYSTKQFFDVDNKSHFFFQNGGKI